MIEGFQVDINDSWQQMTVGCPADILKGTFSICVTVVESCLHNYDIFPTF